jgi:hypothetical protein
VLFSILFHVNYLKLWFSRKIGEAGAGVRKSGMIPELTDYSFRRLP